MTVIQLYGVLVRYGVDVLLLALGVALLAHILKKTVMKSVNGKVLVVLPFGLGILIYAVYGIASRGSLCFSSEELLALIGRGFATGCAATLYDVLYEQLLRGKLDLDPLLPLLACVSEEKRSEASAAILAACKNAGERDLCEVIAEQLRLFADPPLSDEELRFTARLLKEYISSVT